MRRKLRASVWRQGARLSAAQVAEAARRERETSTRLDSLVADRGPYATDPGDLAEQWAARHTEWRRTAALIGFHGRSAYNPGEDVQGSEWARERDERRTGAVVRHAAWQQKRQDAREELRTEVWLSADPSRRLRTIAARTGLRPEQLLIQLADYARLNDDGTLAVEPFTPQWCRMRGRAQRVSSCRDWSAL
ncbi:hypothetical protein [Streptomyces sp. NPDC101776]|uniref:hypothetical protein n=1 Tax=Streptomyces sp. NPDC101776 TaxID=3366146 RepID=UPI0037FCA448